MYSEKKPSLFCPNNNYSIEDHSVALELWGYFLQKKVCKSKVVSRSSTNAQKSTTKNMGKAEEPFFSHFWKGERVSRKKETSSSTLSVYGYINHWNRKRFDKILYHVDDSFQMMYCNYKNMGKAEEPFLSASLAY